MKKLALLFYTVFFVSHTLSGLPVHAVEINSDLDTFEKSLEKRVTDQIKLFYADRYKLAINLRVILTPPTENARAKKTMNLDEQGYAPFPPDLMDEVYESPTAKKIDVDHVEVDVQAPQDTPEPILESVKTILENSLKVYSPKINILKVTIPPEAPKAPESATQPDKEKFDWKAFVPIFAALLAALILMIGGLLIGNSLQGAAGVLAESLRSAHGTVKLDDAGIERKEPSGAEEGDDTSLASPLRSVEKLKASLSSEQATAHFERNLKIVQTALNESPQLFSQTIRDTDAEWKGIMSLLPSLSLQEQGTLRGCIGEDRMSRFNAITEPSQEPAQWLQSFVERLTLKKVQGSSRVEQVIGSDLATRLSRANPKLIFEVCKTLNSAEAWRLFIEFVPQEELSRLSEEMSDTQWQLLVAGVDFNEANLKATAMTICSRVDKDGQSDQIKMRREEYYKRSLLAPMIKKLETLPCTEDELFVQGIEEKYPDFVGVLKEHIWLPSQLDQVPPEFLSQFVRSLSYEDRVGMLLALPAQQAKRIEDLIPAGNIKVITMDKLNRSRQKRDPKELQAANEACRRALARLRQLHMDGKFQLNDKTREITRGAA